MKTIHLVEKCREHGLSVGEVSDAANVNRSTLREWNNNPKKHALLEIVLTGVETKKKARKHLNQSN